MGSSGILEPRNCRGTRSGIAEERVAKLQGKLVFASGRLSRPNRCGSDVPGIAGPLNVLDRADDVAGFGDRAELSKTAGRAHIARVRGLRYIARGRRSVAQPGRALLSGGRGRRFKSSHSDQLFCHFINGPRRPLRARNAGTRREHTSPAFVPRSSHPAIVSPSRPRARVRDTLPAEPPAAVLGEEFNRQGGNGGQQTAVGGR